MMGGEPLETVEFLARSPARVAVLRALDGRELGRRQLADETGVPRSTLSRALTSLEDRDWIRSEGGVCTATPAGSLLLARFDPLVETAEALETLEDSLAAFPIEDLSLDVRHLRDATVVEPDEFNPTAPEERSIGRLRESEHVRCVARVVPPRYVEVLQQRAVSGDLSVEVVLDNAYLDAIAGTETAERWRGVASEGIVRRHEGPIPYRLTVLDGVVHLRVCSAGGEGRPLVESRDPRVRTWAESVVADHLETAERID